MSALTEIIKQFSGQYNTITLQRPYIKFTGSPEGGLLLSQMIYWADRTKDPNGWFYKTYSEWEEEIGVKKKSVAKFASAWVGEGFLETGVRKNPQGTPVVHYRFSIDLFADKLTDFLESANQPDRKFQAGVSSQLTRSEVPVNPIGSSNQPDRKCRSARTTLYTSNTSSNTSSTNTTPEREEVFEEVISGELVSESDPTRSDFVVKKVKDSGSDLEIFREDQIAAAPKISREATERADNLQEAQLRRKGIDPIDYNRFRAIYAPYVNGVTQYGFGSDEYAHREWLNLQRNGWVADADFWRGLELESIWGLELYRKTKTSIPGVPGGAAFLSSRRWEQAIERDTVNKKLKSVDLEMHFEKPKDLRLSDSISKMNEVANRVIDRILAKDQETQLLEASHDF